MWYSLFYKTEHEVMSDRGFSIQELCAMRVITLNRTKQEENDQFDQRHVTKNFEIAASGIHVERFMEWYITGEY